MAGDAYPGRTVSDEVDEELFRQFAFCDELLNRIYKFLEVVNTTFQQLHIQGTMKGALLKQATTFCDKHKHICRRTLNIGLFVADEITLQIPDLDLEPAVDVLSSNSEIVQELEQYVMNWHTHIAVVIEEQQQKYPQVCDCFYVLNSNRCRSGAIAVVKLQFVTARRRIDKELS